MTASIGLGNRFILKWSVTNNQKLWAGIDCLTTFHQLISEIAWDVGIYFEFSG
jgi:hypothetical protein